MDAVEDIKGRLNIEDVIAEYVELKRSGRNFKGLSPFANEKTPSFMVSPEKQIWHDFSSGKGGNIFSFVMEMEGLDFKGALELLARKAGVDLSQYRSKSSGDFTKRKERLMTALDVAARFYQVQFSKHKGAWGYIFDKRKFTKETALQFRIGYSPNTGSALRNFLKAKGFSDDELKQAGLVTQRYRTPNDMFRGRIMIPLMDGTGRVIGFTARLLEDMPDAPKYINTPQTVLYDKSRHVFGLHLAKEAIRTSGYAVLVEGNMDVIASHQAGVRQVVATAGTALTSNHIQQLSRLTQDIRLAFDADKAGQNAAERSIPIASKESVSLSIVMIPGQKDPDDLIKEDPALWAKAIEEKQYALDWLIERHKELINITTAQGKRQFSDVLMPVVRGLDDKVEQDHYVGQIAELIGVHADALRSKMASQVTSRPNQVKAKQPDREPAAPRNENLKRQHHILAICLLRPDLRQFLSPLDESMFNDESARKLHAFLLGHRDFTGSPARVPELQELGDYVKILSLQFDELYAGLETLELQYEAARLQARIIEDFVKMKKSQLAAEMRAGDETAMAGLLEQAKSLDKLLKSIKGDSKWPTRIP